MGPLRAYLLAKLLWNPATDLQKHTTEFLDAYYRRSAPHIQAYLQLLQNQVRDPQVHAHIYDPPTAAYLNPSFLTTADQLLSKAEDSAENETIRFRLQTAHLPIWYVQLAAGRVQKDARAALLSQFLAVARKAGISDISEGQTLDAWAAAMGAK